MHRSTKKAKGKKNLPGEELKGSGTITLKPFFKNRTKRPCSQKRYRYVNAVSLALEGARLIFTLFTFIHHYSPITPSLHSNVCTCADTVVSFLLFSL